MSGFAFEKPVLLTGLATRRPFETAEDAAEGWIVFGSCCSDDAGPEFPTFRV